VRFGAYDAAAPVLGRTSLPSYAAAKRPATFTAVAEDRVGPLSFAWRFGDRKAGKGDEVSHVYKRKGTYLAALAVTDLAGNTVSRSRKVKVLAPALHVGLKARFAPGNKRTRVTMLSLKRLVRGAKVTIACRGTGCPFDTRKISVTGKTLALTPLLDGAGLAQRVRLWVEVTAPRPKKASGRYFSFVMQDGTRPRKGDGCLTPTGKRFGC